MQRTSVVVGHERCPACEKVGRDRSGDNLAVYSDGHKFCFACGHHVRARLSLSGMRSRIGSSNAGTNTSLDSHVVRPRWGEGGTWEHLGRDTPEAVRSYVHNLQIDPEKLREYRLYWERERRLLVWAHVHSGSLLFYSARYFGPDPKHPKYISGGSRISSTRELVRGRMAHPNTKVLVFTEDVVSALRCSDGREEPSDTGIAAVPLYGTTIPFEYIIGDIRPGTRIRLWLDRDKAKEAIVQAARLRQWFPNTSTIISERDPKYYNKKEINEFVFGNTEGIPEPQTVEPVQ